MGDQVTVGGTIEFVGLASEKLEGGRRLRASHFPSPNFIISPEILLLFPNDSGIYKAIFKGFGKA
jgi:hypothetical protein